MNLSQKYDAIVIGGGIGGLICGCYLAKEGIKVLLVEKHTQFGGYCSSFKRRGYFFDAAVHSLRGLKEKNQLGVVFKDLDLKHVVPLTRIDPSDIVIYGDKRVFIYNNIRDTIDSFKSTFQNQKKEIEKFFKFICSSDFIKLYKFTYNKTFAQILNIFFAGQELKFFFNILLGNLGLDSDNISALSAIVFFNELFTDGGYYPKHGMQSFPDALAQKICDYGGTAVLKNEVKKIVLENNIAKGIILENGNMIEGQTIISNIDARTTYLKLIGEQKLDKNFVRHIRHLIVSPSASIVYLGIKKKIADKNKCCTLWYFPSRESLNCYKDSFKGKTNILGKYAICGFSSANIHDSSKATKSSITLTMITPWKNSSFWKQKKEGFSEQAINRASEILGNLDHCIDVKEIATPITLKKYTCNYKGAAYGWASLPWQINKSIMPQKTGIKQLYLCGHWATRGWGQGGISMVVNSGRTTAQMILKRKTIY